MTGLEVKEKAVVVPGEKLATGMDYLPADGTYRNGEDIFANRLGLVHVSGRAIKIIPLAGAYLPKRGDNIIGKVIDITLGGWRVEFDCAYSAMLSMRDGSSDFIAKGADLTRYYDIGDYLVAKIVQVTSQNLIDISTRGPGLRKLRGGRILKINPTKVPRVIGKNGSMVSMIKDFTGCRVIVGQNGLIWINGTPEMEILASETINKIASESHIPGLTEKIRLFLEEKVPNKPEAAPAPQTQAASTPVQETQAEKPKQEEPKPAAKEETQAEPEPAKKETTETPKDSDGKGESQ